MQMLNCDKSMQAETVIADAVLQAARSAMPADFGRWYADGGAQFHAAGHKNRDLLPLLEALIDAACTVSRAIGDNAWDDCRPVPEHLAFAMADQVTKLRSDIINATQCPDANSFDHLQTPAPQ